MLAVDIDDDSHSKCSTNSIACSKSEFLAAVSGLGFAIDDVVLKLKTRKTASTSCSKLKFDLGVGVGNFGGWALEESEIEFKALIVNERFARDGSVYSNQTSLKLVGNGSRPSDGTGLG